MNTRQLLPQEVTEIEKFIERRPHVGTLETVREFVSRSCPLSVAQELREALWKAWEDIHQLLRVAKHNRDNPETIAVNQVHQAGIDQSEQVLETVRAVLSSSEQYFPKQ